MRGVLCYSFHLDVTWVTAIKVQVYMSAEKGTLIAGPFTENRPVWAVITYNYPMRMCSKGQVMVSGIMNLNFVCGSVPNV